MKITKRQIIEAYDEALSIKKGSKMRITESQLRRLVRKSIISEIQTAMPEEGGPPVAPAAPKTQKSRWKAEVTNEYDKGYKDAMADIDPSEDASRSYDDGYTDALADIAEEEEIAHAASVAPPVA